jgi:hypothetical protein
MGHSIYVQWQLFFPGKYSDLYFCVYFLTGLSAWAFAASSVVIGIYGGGPAIEIWGTLAIGASLSVFCLNLAEYGLAFPSAGGCTYRLHCYSTEGTKIWSDGGKNSRCETGCVEADLNRATSLVPSILFTVAFIPPVLILVLSEIIPTRACFFHPDFIPKRWQMWILFQVFNVMYLGLLKYGNAIIGELNGIGSLYIPNIPTLPITDFFLSLRSTYWLDCHCWSHGRDVSGGSTFKLVS